MTVHDILEFLNTSHADTLFGRARTVADTAFARSVFVRGVVEFSNYCKKNCHYCGLRKDNEQLARFRLAGQEILAAASLAVGLGAGTVVLQSGEDAHFDRTALGGIIQDIKKAHDVAVTLCVGDHDRDTYAYWHDCGADRYLLKLETTHESLHAALRPGTSVAKRLARLELLQAIGYETGSGIIVDLPGMTDAMLAEDILRLSALGLDMIAAGPCIPHPQTPLRGAVSPDIEKSLRVIAVLRLLNPVANIPATSALDALAQDGRLRALAAGANVVMPSVTPVDVRDAYALYPGKNTSKSSVPDAVRALLHRVSAAGYTPVADRGSSGVFANRQGDAND